MCSRLHAGAGRSAAETGVTVAETYLPASRWAGPLHASTPQLNNGGSHLHAAATAESAAGVTVGAAGVDLHSDASASTMAEPQ